MKTAICSVFLLLSVSFQISTFAQNQKKVIIDADTGNEVDDLYAVVRGLIEPSWNVLGLTATQWQVSHWSVEKSMEESYRINEILVSYLNLSDKVPCFRGAEARLFDWGNKAQTSAASNFIIREARKMKDEKLNILALGALTNVASAILDDPSITGKIRLYWLGSSYNFEEGYMKNIDFNSVMDIQAVDVIFNSDVELHVIPNKASEQMKFYWDETVQQFRGKHELLDYLLNRWYNHMDAGIKERTIWDLALIQSVIFPEYAEEVSITTSKDMGNRQIWIYKDIDADKMKAEFFSTLLKHVQQLE